MCFGVHGEHLDGTSHFRFNYTLGQQYKYTRNELSGTSRCSEGLLFRIYHKVSNSENIRLGLGLGLKKKGV